jgi:hypothetical protein
MHLAAVVVELRVTSLLICVDDSLELLVAEKEGLPGPSCAIWTLRV